MLSMRERGWVGCGGGRMRRLDGVVVENVIGYRKYVAERSLLVD
jgi:hypothetical protein